MTKNLSKVFLVLILICIAVYIGVFIGRTSAKNVFHISNIENQEENDGIRKIDLNEATVDDLTDIPGIDYKVAKAIIEYRSEFGQYYKVKELLDVEGVTDDLYEILKQYVTVNN